MCVGGRVNGKNEKLTYKLRSGDTVEVQTSSTQAPKQDWLKYRSNVESTHKDTSDFEGA